jgi:hypothetical protein
MPKQKAPATAKAKSSLSWVGDLHHTMQQALGLSGQLQSIDYTGVQFVHADLSLEEFQRLKEQKSESFLGLFLKAYQTQQELMANGHSGATMSMPQLLSLLSGSGSRAEAKRALAKQFHEVERLMTGVEGDQGTVILGERNNKALSVLEQQLKLQRRKLALFYGAAHLPDLEKKLIAQGWKILGSPRYLDAWVIEE